MKDNNQQTSVGAALQSAQQKQQTQQPAAQQTQSQSQAQQQQTQQRMSLFGGGLSNIGFSRSPEAAALASVRRGMDDVLKNVDTGDFTIELLTIDNNSDTRLALSALVVAAYYKNRPEALGFHILLLEGSSEPFRAKTVSIDNLNVEVPMYAARAADGTLIKIAAELVRRTVPGNNRLFYADATVVPRTFDAYDERLIKGMLYSAVSAATTTLRQELKIPDLNLAMVPESEQLEARVLFQQPTLNDAVGLPVRGDIRIVLEVGAAGGQEVAERTHRITTLVAHMDLLYDPEETMQHRNFLGGQSQQSGTPKLFTPTAIIRALDPEANLSMNMHLLSVAQVAGLGEGHVWVESLRPRPDAVGTDIRDVGVLILEATGQILDTRSNEFRPEHHNLLLGSVCRDRLTVQMSIADCSPSAWAMNAFLAMTNINSDNKSAVEAAKRAYITVLRSANELTNNEFSDLFPDGELMVAPFAMRGLAGYYTDGQGVKRDIAELDYIAFANLVGRHDKEMLRQFRNTYFGTDSEPLRLSKRRTLIERALPSVVFTGESNIVTFTPKFIDALTTAISRVKRIRLRLPVSEVNSLVDTTAASLSQYSWSGAQGGGMFSNNGRGDSGFSQLAASSSNTRWGVNF